MSRTSTARRSSVGALRDLERIGAWWGPVPQPTPDNPRRQAEGQIEVVAAQGSRVVLAGEAKWTHQPVGFGALNHLREVLLSLPGADAETQLVLFGRRFDPRLASAAQAEGVTLVAPADLYAQPGDRESNP